MITTQSMRYFAADCLKWALDMEDASHRQSAVDAAREWAKIADAIDRRVESGRVEVVADLKSNLN